MIPMELVTLFFYSFGIGFSGALMPGPLLAVGLAETPRNGWQTGPIISIGHAIAEVAVVVALAFGAAAISRNPWITHAIGVIGGLALVLMGGSMVWEILRKKVNYDLTGRKPDPGHKLAGKGITATLSNPYWFLWWATIGLALLVKSQEFGWVGPVVFYFGHILSDFVWYTAVSIVLWRGSKLLLGRGLQVLILGCAAFLLYLGVTFIFDGLTGSLASLS